MAKKIQDGERQGGKTDFQGFVFEGGGRADESVTCNAIEWIYSFGGGAVVDPDKKVSVLETAAQSAPTAPPSDRSDREARSSHHHTSRILIQVLRVFRRLVTVGSCFERPIRKRSAFTSAENQ